MKQELSLRRALIHLGAAVLVALTILGAVPPARAEIPASVLSDLGIRDRDSAADRDLYDLQTDLSLLGFYAGLINGIAGTETRTAAGQFQVSLGGTASGRLSPDERQILRTRAASTLNAAGFRRVAIDWTGMSVRLPTNMLRTPTVSGEDLTNVLYSSTDASGFRVSFIRFESGMDPSGILRAIRTNLDEDEAEEIAASQSGNTVGVTSEREGQYTIWLYQRGNGEIRGLQMSFDIDSLPAMRPFISDILPSIDLFAGPGVPMSQIGRRLADGTYPGGDTQPDWYRSMIASGSGSLVSYDGHILTNHHVVSGCARVTVNGQPAIFIGSDLRTDLALLRSDRFSNRTPVSFIERDAELGSTVYVMGFPVFTTSQSLNITNGIVSSVVGLYGNRNHIQITAPVQPGNSGGPVLNADGAQVAVVVSKPSLSLRLESSIENIAWVIRASVAQQFLERYGVRPRLRSERALSVLQAEADVQDWRTFTVRVECHNR